MKTVCVALLSLLFVGGCGSVEEARKPDTQKKRFVIWVDGQLKCPQGTALQRGPDDDDTCPRGYYEWCARPDGNRHGPFRARHQNKRRCGYGHYREGKQEGRWFWFFPSGNFEMQQCWQGHRVLWESNDYHLARKTSCP